MKGSTKNDGEGIGDGHDLDAGDEGDRSRQKEEEGPQAGIGKCAGGKAQSQSHQDHDGQHEGGLHDKARGGDLAHGHGVFGGEFGRDVEEGRDHAEGEHQEDALKGGVLGHASA